MRYSFAALAAAFALSAQSVQAFVLSGADLLSDPEASFPKGLPSQVGNAIVFDSIPFSGGANDFYKLLVYRVNPLGTLPQGGTIIIEASFNLTRRACDNGDGCSAGDPADFDPHFLLTDGSTMYGFSVADNDGGTLSALSEVDAGTVGTARTIDTSQIGTGYPPIGASADVILRFTLFDTGTTAEIDFQNGSLTHTWNSPLARNASLALALVRDNDRGERYQVNSLTFPEPAAVPEPMTMALVGLGLAGLTFSRRKQ